MKICSSAQMREIDRTASAIGGIPSIILMENAAFSCVSEIKKLNPKKVGIFCGKGNNGGDGLAIARQLSIDGCDVEVFLTLGNDFSGDALINYEILEKMKVKITEITDNSPLEYYISAQDLIVDAIFGTGMHGEISGTVYDVIEAINRFSRYTLSVDIPSGVDADSGSIAGIAVNADLTVTFAAYKKGMFLYPASQYCGRLVPAKISIPDYIPSGCEFEAEAIDFQTARTLIPRHRDNAHKGDCGKVFTLGGSPGMTGALTLCSLAALKCGAGLVTAGVAKSLNPIMEVKLTEVMTYPLPDCNGSISPDAADKIQYQAEKSDVLLIGPGLGRSTDLTRLVSTVLSYSKIPVVVDADALFAVSEMPDMLTACGCGLVFTPHEAEFARLIGADVDKVSKNRLELSRAYAAENGVTLVLKGHHTVVTAPNGMQYINTSGNSGMATGGSGDVLGGMIAAFIAAGLEETDAAVLAVYLHGFAGDIAAKKLGKLSLTALDICNNISDAILSVQQ